MQLEALDDQNRLIFGNIFLYKGKKSESPDTFDGNCVRDTISCTYQALLNKSVARFTIMCSLSLLLRLHYVGFLGTVDSIPSLPYQIFGYQKFG